MKKIHKMLQKMLILAVLLTPGLIMPATVSARVPDLPPGGSNSPTSTNTGGSSSNSGSSGSTSSVDDTTKSAIQCGVNSAASGDCNTGPSTSLDNTILSIVNVLTIVGGIIAVIMIIIGGLRYVTSGGKQESVTSAKNTILYAVIGLVIIALAQIIARFVLQKATNA